MRGIAMAKRKNEKSHLHPPQEDEEREVLYAKMRQQFTAADLQKYTEIEPGVPLENVIAEMEQIHRQTKQSKRKKA
jgi:hypothetical protein